MGPSLPGFDAAPRLVGSGLDPDGRKTLTYIDGEFTQPGPSSLDGAAAVDDSSAISTTPRPTTSSPNAKGYPHWPTGRGNCAPSSTGLRPAGQPAPQLPRPHHRVRHIRHANEADDAKVTPDMTSHPCALWAMAWRARAAAWLIRTAAHWRTPSPDRSALRNCPIDQSVRPVFLRISPNMSAMNPPSPTPDRRRPRRRVPPLSRR